jgi:hypothetical protein
VKDTQHVQYSTVQYGTEQPGKATQPSPALFDSADVSHRFVTHKGDGDDDVHVASAPCD